MILKGSIKLIDNVGDNDHRSASVVIKGKIDVIRFSHLFPVVLHDILGLESKLFINFQINHILGYIDYFG